MSLRYDKRFLIDEAINWWESRLDLEGDEYAASLFSLGQDEIMGRLIYLVKTRIECGSWKPGKYFWGTERRKFGTSRKLPEEASILHQVLKPCGIESVSDAGWPEDAIMYIDPGRVFVLDEGIYEIVYGDWLDE